MKEVLLGKRLKISYKVRINHLNRSQMIPRSLSAWHLHHAYAHNFGAVIAIFLGIEGINVLILLEIKFLYIFAPGGRKLRHKINIETRLGEKVAGGW